VILGDWPRRGLSPREARRHGAQSPSGDRPLGLSYGTAMITKDDVVEALHDVEDPELGMDIVELGLYYDAEIEGERVKVIHSLTSMGCPAGPMIQENIHDAVAALPGVEQVEVELTFDPPWTPDRMSDDAKFILGFG
jgi:metal-sulfur cluster biosynthetic enzyme